MPFLTKVKPLWDRSTLTLAELAAQCNISESSASRYLNGKISPPADVAERILEVLSADIVTPPAPEEKPQAAVPPVLQIWEVYKEEIEILQNNHANHISTILSNHSNHVTALQATHATHLAALQSNYASQITDLKRDKKLLACITLVLFCLLVYFILDGLHGDWGIIRYAFNAVGGVSS